MSNELNQSAEGSPLERWVRAQESERAEFERWYVKNCFDLERNPLGSRDCSLQWDAWRAARAWTPTSERKPRGGQLIVKRWRHGAVWAGTHDEGPKNESFQEWKAL